MGKNKNKPASVKIHPLTLVFCDESKDLEPEYQEYHYENSLVIQRIAILVAVFFYAFFGILDAYLVPENKQVFWLIRYAVVCPAAVAVFLFTFSKKYKQFKNVVLFFLFVVGGFGIDMMILLADPPAAYSYYTGIILILVYLFCVIRIGFIWAFFASWLIIAFYEIIAAGLIDTPAAVLVNNNFFIIAANIFCIMAGYSIERTARINFFLNRTLAIEKQAVTTTNAELKKQIERQIIAEKALKEKNAEIESIVKDRTASLKKNQLSHQRFINNAPIGMYSINLNGEFTFINKRLEEITGYRAEDWIGKSFHPIVYPEDLPKVFTKLKSRLQGKEKQEPYQTRIVTAKNEILWVEIISESVYEEHQGEKKLVEIQTFVEDVTKIKRSRETNSVLFAISNAVNTTKNLDDLYKQIHGLLENIIDVDNFFIAIVNAKERTLYFPYHVDSVDDDFSTITDFDPKDSLTGFVVSKGMPLLIKQEKLRNLADRNGVWGPVPLIWMGVPLIVRDEIIGVVAVQSYTDPEKYTEQDLDILTSISAQIAVAIDRKRTEEELRKSEEKFRISFKTSPHVVAISEIAHGTYIDVNDAFSKQMGYRYEEVIGRSSLELSIWCDLEDRHQLISRLEKEGLVENLQADFKARDGQIINGLVSASTLEINGRQFLLAVIQDMTKVRAMEQERLDLEIRLQQAEKMEAIGTLAGGIAHDFNNILAGILGYSELAQKDVGNPEKTKAHLVQIEKGSKRAAELVKQILTFSRKDVYQKHPLQAALAVKEALQLLRSSIPSSIEIRKKIHSASYILADQIKIHQLIINLFTNACHAIGDNQGSICIALTDNVIKKAQKTGSELIPPGIYLVLEVTDTGAGMDPAIMEKVFDPYFTTKQTGEGTGLGLALVKAIVKEHDGYIAVNSEAGQGTSFFVYFPVFEKEPENTDLPSDNQESLEGSESIMVVDDEKAIRDLAKEFLHPCGYQVSVFENGHEALAEFARSPEAYDLVITDMTMPRMTGDKLAMAIMEINPEIPVLLCTGFSETMSEKNASSIGIKKILNKPFLMNDLLRAVRELLAGVHP